MTELKRWDEILRRLKKIKRPVVAEIGVDNGKTSKRLLAGHPGLILYMVDWWQAPPKENSYKTSGASIPDKPKEYFEKTFKNCKAIAAKYQNRAHIVKMESARAAIFFENDFFDLVFIDADHSFEGCMKDINAWLPKVKKGGYLCGHDYDHPDQGQVKEAVAWCLPGKKIVLGGNRTWFYKVE